MGFARFRSARQPITSNKRLAALTGALVLALALALAPAAAANPGDPLQYFGGPVAHSMTGYVVDWGSSINSIYTNDSTGDPGLIKYLAASSGATGNFSSVLAQYMDSSGSNAAPQVSYGGQIPITPSPRDNTATISDVQIQDELVAQISAGALPPPGGDGLSTIYLVLFPPNRVECLDGACSGQDFCAYHGSAELQDTNHTPVLYAVLPDNTTGGMSRNCGSASTPLANQTSFLSHEWAEAITDPLVAQATSTAAPLAWYDNNCTDPSGLCGEVGDKCNAQQAQEGGFTVQLEWSNLESTCEPSEPTYSTPTAAFNASAGGLVGQPVSFDGTGSTDPPLNKTAIKGTNYAIGSGIASYSWNWGDSTPSVSGRADAGAGIQTHTFSAPCTCQVSVTVTDNLGFQSTLTKAVEVSSPNPSPPAASTGGTTGVDAQDATLDGAINTGGQPVSYHFAYGTSSDPSAWTLSTPSAHLGPGVGSEPVSATVTGLTPSTTYYYQLIAQTADGQTYPAPPPVQSFTTAPASTSSSGGTGPGSQGSTTPAPTPTPTPTPAPAPAPAPAAPQLPSVSTGGVSGLTSSGATVSGSVDPNGTQTTYLVEYGTSTAYGHSSLPASAGAGASSLAVSSTLSGLRPKTLYHYRVVATSATGTAVGADRTFKTPAAPPSAPRFSSTAPSRVTLAQALSGRLRVRFHCSTACTAHFTVTVSLPGVKRLQAIPVTFGRGTGSLRRAGAGQATLHMTSAARSALRRASSVKLVISGYAVRGNSAPSPPRSSKLLLTR